MVTEQSFDYANAHALTEQLWVGGDLEIFDEPLAEAQLAELAEAGLTHIIDVRLEWDDLAWVAARRPDVEYLHLGVADAGQPIPDRGSRRGPPRRPVLCPILRRGYTSTAIWVSTGARRWRSRSC